MKTPFDDKKQTQEQFQAEAQAKFGRSMDRFETVLSNDEKTRQAIGVLSRIHKAQGHDYGFKVMVGNSKGDMETFRVTVAKIEVEEE